MRKVLGWMLIIFFLLVGFDYVSGALFHPILANQLASINFSFFGKGGLGRSYITQGYGRTSFAYYTYKSDRHNGIDIAAGYGAPIYSPGKGIVMATGNQDDYCRWRGFGRYVAVADDANHLVLWYAHLGKIYVEPGDAVKKGMKIGTVGNTGFETGTHLHFSVFDLNGFSMKNKNGCGPDPDGKDLDPLSYLGTTYQ